VTKTDEVQLLEDTLRDHQAIWRRALFFVDDPSELLTDRIWAKEFLAAIIPTGADLRWRLATARARQD
jgi:hypothetical protein